MDAETLRSVGHRKAFNMLWNLVKDWKFELRKRFIGFRVPDEPHFDEKSRMFFRRRLKLSTNYLEFGSGGSTVLAVKMGKVGVSIEGDKHFCRDVRKKVRNKNKTMELIHVDVGMTGAWGRPRNKKQTPARLAKWRRYIDVPFERPLDPFYDLILVDGRFRLACALKTLQEGAKRKANFTLIVDDYVGRKKYWMVEKFAKRTKTIGRMAVFEITGGAMLETPTDEHIASAIKDMA
jgi:hypothetical protein